MINDTHSQKSNTRRGEIFAFFDVDETIWNTKSILDFYKFYLDNAFPADSKKMWYKFQEEVKKVIGSGISREETNTWFYREQFQNVSINYIRELTDRWYTTNCEKAGFWRDEVVEIVEQHSNLGHSVVFVSGSFRELLLPLKKRFSATAILCTPLEEKAGCYTGKMTDIPMIGTGKKKAISQFLQNNNVDLENSFGYGDDETDIPFLQSVGKAYLVSKPGTHDSVTFTNISSVFRNPGHPWF